MRRSAAAMAGFVFAGLGGTAIAVREFRLQRDIDELRSRSRAQNERLSDIVSLQEDLVRSNRGLVLTLQSLSETAAHRRSDGLRPEPKKPHASTEDTRPAPLPPEAIESADKARMMIEGAIGSGRWTEQNRADLHALLTRIPGEERKELMRRVITALNAHQLEFQAPGPPF
jgi:hypothetical protein